MSEHPHDPNDERPLEDYLSRDSDLSRAYRDSATEAPSAALDARVLQMAQDELRTRKPRWMAWTAPLAVAASALVVLSIVIRPDVVEQAAVSDLPKVRESAGASRELSEAPARAASDEAVDADRAMSESEPAASPARSAPFAPPSEDASAPVQSPPPPAPRYEAVRESAALEERTVVQSAAEAREATSETSSSRALRARQSVDFQRSGAPQKQTEDPERWVERIRKLYADGELEQAKAEWRLFRSAYPDHPVDPPAPFAEDAVEP